LGIANQGVIQTYFIFIVLDVNRPSLFIFWEIITSQNKFWEINSISFEVYKNESRKIVKMQSVAYYFCFIL